MSRESIRVMHVITTLATGGAEITLYRLLSKMRHRNVEHRVVSLTGDGPVGEKIRALNIPIFPLDVRRLAHVPAALAAVARSARGEPADIVHTWLYHADLLGGLAGKLASNAKIVWHIHHSGLTPPAIRPRTRQIARCCARLSRCIPDRIVCCSQAGLRSHSEFGFDQQRMTVIPNGFDIEEFHPDPSRRMRMRAALGANESSILVGLVGRFAAVKDHRTFIAACEKVAGRCPRPQFVLAGDGITGGNVELMSWIRNAGLEDRCLLLDRQDDMPGLLAALDVLVSSSVTEAFPCVVGEAMASAVPCVVTDVGDSASLVADTGFVVPPRDPDALAARILEMTAMNAGQRREMGNRARALIERKFSLESFAGRFETLYREMNEGQEPAYA